MYKKVLKFKDFDGNPREETLYFNLNKVEMIEMQVGAEGGSFTAWAQGIIDAQNNSVLIKEFKRLILMAYGKKSADGSSFAKSEEISKEFEQTAAFVEMFTLLASDDKAAAEFVEGLVPAEMRAELQAMQKEYKDTGDIPTPGDANG